MRANVRAYIASAAGCLISGIEHPSIYDHSQAQYISIRGRVSDKDIYLFDRDRKCYFSGNGKDYSFDLYDHSNQSHINLEINGNNFKGFEHDSGSYYNGYSNDGFVILFDSDEDKYFQYSL